MNTCPPVERWQSFLDDGLEPGDDAGLTTHLEDCPDCVRTLEHLTTPALDQSADGCRTSATPVPAAGAEWQRLKHLLPATEAVGLVAHAHLGLPHVPGYEIERELGRGGMGVVYLARQTQLNRRVALKMVLTGQYTTQAHVIRFLAEAQTCAGLRHANIVQIFDVGQHNGVPFYSMEYVEGGTLAQRVRRAPLTPHVAAAVVETLARAMHFAHQGGIIHRDLKPANVLLDGSMGQDSATTTVSPHRDNAASAVPALVPKISDFGLAKRFDRDDGLTQTGATVGTPEYMAPEQLEPGRAPVGPGADVYALGAILYCLLTGRPPFTAATTWQLLAKVRDTDALVPSRLNRAVPHELSLICLHCLEKDSRRRYATAEALADDLRRFRSGEPIAVKPTSDAERLWKWAKRRPAIALLSALLIGVVFTSLGLVSWQWYQAEEARRREADRANSEAEAKRNEAEARRQGQILSANYALEDGIQRCQAGQVEAGLLSMIRALELLPADESDLEFAIRTNIGAWRARLCPAQRGPPQGTAVTCVATSADGQTALVGNWGNIGGHATPAQAHLTRLDRWEQPPLWTVEHPGAVWSVAFHPRGDRVAVGGFDGTTCVRTVTAGSLCFPPLSHPGRVYSVAFSPDGKTLAVGGQDADAKATSAAGVIRFWDADTGTALGEPQALPFLLYTLAWAPDGKSLVLGGLDRDKVGTGAGGLAVSYDFDKRTLSETRMIHGDVVRAVAIHPAGKLLATGCADGRVRFWSWPQGTLQPKALPHAYPVNGLQFSKSGVLLATASGHHEPGVRSGTGEVRVWEVATATPHLSPQFEPRGGNSQKMHAVAFGDDDRKLIAACEHGNAWAWTLPPPLAPVETFPLKDAALVTHSPDGRTMLLTVLPPRLLGFAKKPSEVHIIRTADFHTTAVLPFPACVFAHFSADGKRFLTIPADPSVEVCLWDADTGKSLPLPASMPRVLDDVCFTADGKTLVTLTASGLHQRWDATALTPLDAPKPCLDQERVLAFDSKGSRLLVSGPGGTRLVALPACQTLATLHGKPTEFGCFTAQDAVAVTVARTDSPQVRRWRAVDGQPLTTPVSARDRYLTTANHRILIDLVRGATTRDWTDSSDVRNGTDFPVDGEIAMHPTGKFIVSTERGIASQVMLWSTANGKTIGPPLPHAHLYTVAFHPNGQWLITSSNDKTTKIWQVPSPAESSADALRAALKNR